MDYRQLLDSKILLFGVLISVAIQGCSSSRNAQEAANTGTLPAEQAQPQSESLDTESDIERPNPVIVTYQNASSNIQLSLDPSKDEFYLDLRGITPTEKDSIVVVDSTIVQNRAIDIQTLLSSYRKAQDLFYLGEYRQALEEVDNTLAIQETADAYALKGTIFFMMENPTAARANWNRAVQMDPNIPVPSIPELETLINEILEDGEQ